MVTEKRLIDANGSYTINANDNTGYSMCFCGGIISVFDDFGRCVCEFDAEDAPKADAVEVVHGRWKHKYEKGMSYKVCSICGCRNGLDLKFNYCPNCGTKMDGGENG